MAARRFALWDRSYAGGANSLMTKIHLQESHELCTDDAFHLGSDDVKWLHTTLRHVLDHST